MPDSEHGTGNNGTEKESATRTQGHRGTMAQGQKGTGTNRQNDYYFVPSLSVHALLRAPTQMCGNWVIRLIRIIMTKLVEQEPLSLIY